MLVGATTVAQGLAVLPLGVPGVFLSVGIVVQDSFIAYSEPQARPCLLL